MRIFARSNRRTIIDTVLIAAAGAMTGYAMYDAGKSIGTAIKTKVAHDDIRDAADKAERIREVQSTIKSLEAPVIEAEKVEVATPKVEFVEATKDPVPDMGDMYVRMAYLRAEAEAKVKAQAEVIEDLKARLAKVEATVQAPAPAPTPAPNPKVGRPSPGRKPATPAAQA